MVTEIAKATPSHTLVSGHPPACKTGFQVCEDYYYYYGCLIVKGLIMVESPSYLEEETFKQQLIS